MSSHVTQVQCHVTRVQRHVHIDSLFSNSLVLFFPIIPSNQHSNHELRAGWQVSGVDLKEGLESRLPQLRGGVQQVGRENGNDLGVDQ